MTHGGARQGAGRKASTPDTIAVNWRVSRSAKVWMKTLAMEQGVSIATILDELIKSFEESMIERRRKEIGTCRGCLHYENDCPFIAKQKLGLYPNRVCGDYKNREEQ